MVTLTDDEIGTLALLFQLRTREEKTTLWAAVANELIPAAEFLAQSGLIERHYCRACGDLHWRCADQGMAWFTSHNQRIAQMN